ncbi:hypothetical protein COEREDRAFT_90175 [Coemansia reversa NRRL 1564]|uniref:Probable DNA polymerase n=1 Tax=Coemansia reversa (strain ATCC 12441 / NRRL 1564) TaxID=763665 RepID=A0A2G5B0M0_COERN|nr:hypothetical protein COEREDRAFT_90175 [Coemansia reversa NRRL 1564]|eukprot:PIA12559.1 hypothetical protein COEREDRAFT_90175 [Coemansia reversa NRRL 1564]
MVNYEQIPAKIKPFLEVTQEQFDTYPEFVKQAALEYATKRWLAAGAPRVDSMRYPVQYSVANEDLDELPMNELTDYYYEHQTRQSTMGIVDHRFSLRTTLNVPTPWQYLSMVSHQAQELGATNATLQYVVSDDTVYSLSFSRKDLQAHSVDELLEMLKKGSSEWIKELYTGSDYIQDAIKTYSLAMGRFTITVSHIQGGYGKMIPDYYEVLGLENNDDDCLIQCFLYIYRQQQRNTCESIEKVRKLLLKEGKLGLDCVPLLEDMFQLKVDVYRDYRHLEFNKHRSIGKGISLIDSIKVVIIRDDPVIIYGSGINKWKLLYKDNHFDVITRTYKAEECHCVHTGNFVGYGKQYSKKQLVRELKKKYQPDAENLTQYDGSDDEQQHDVYYYFFDYETVFDPQTMEIMPYAYAIVKCDHNFKILDTQCHIGLGCDKHLSDYLFAEAPTEDETKHLIGYNNSRFDNFLLLKHSLKHNDYVGHVRFAGNTIVSANINGFVVRDLCRILNMSLDKACKAFKIELAKLTGAVKHHEVQMKFMSGKTEFSEYLAHMQNIIRQYVIRDCESLSQLYKFTKRTMNRLINLDVEEHYTLAGMTYAAFKNMVEKEDLPVLSRYYERHDRFVRKAIIGGRSQMRLCKREKGDLCAIDCVSLYPYVMLNRHFPIGMPLDTTTYIKDKIGVYKVIVYKQCEEKHNIVPLRNEKTHRLDWNWKGEIECVLCSVDIECLKRHGAQITIRNGIYWEENTNSLFDQYFKPLIMEKQKQDIYRDSACTQSQYNPAIRETCKLLMNSLSGKLAQKLYFTETEIVRNASDVDRFYTRTIPGTQTFVQLGPAFIAQGRKEPIATTPCIYGVLIYAYAREHMYESILKHLQVGELYGMDTDSAFITHDCLSRVDKHLIGNDFGQFKVELDHCNGIFIAPKCYIFYNNNDCYSTSPSGAACSSGEVIEAPPPRTAKRNATTTLMDEPVEDIKVIVKARFKGVKIGKDIELKGDIDNKKDPVALYKLYHSNKSTKVGLHTFKRLLTDKSCEIVCCNIDKLVSAPSHNAGLYLANHTFVKEITVKQNEGNQHHLDIIDKTNIGINIS